MIFVPTFRNAIERNEQDNRRQWQVDEKDRAPGDLLDQPTADHGTDRRGDGGESGPSANRAPAIFIGKRRTDDGEAAGNQQCATDTLNSASKNEFAHAADESAPDRRQGE